MQIKIHSFHSCFLDPFFLCFFYLSFILSLLSYKTDRNSRAHICINIKNKNEQLTLTFNIPSTLYIQLHHSGKRKQIYILLQKELYNVNTLIK